ncbi:MAG: glycoside hydrolase family 2 TIM barrel-domain containing protein [Deltaproteobacteria bacterium]|nr:glycoside hydrolase family 2 TIM barrel-domain containing protein [Deltaproteobacteria bacterium]
MIPNFKHMMAASDGHGYPRPQLVRPHWESLNGSWRFALDPEATWSTPEQVRWDRDIIVPFAPETPRSGVGDTGLYRCCWYHKRVPIPVAAPGERVLLHFGAVDNAATVWMNGRYLGSHEGGYTPFYFDVTDFINADLSQMITVRAYDDPADLTVPRGKQDWQPEPHSIWYPRTTGIWQTVWMERVPSTYVGSVRFTPSLLRWEIGFEAWLHGDPRDDLFLDVRLAAGGRVLVDDRYAVIAGEVHRRIALSDPGIDDSRNELLWSPTSPRIIDATLTLRDGDGTALETMGSYTAIRSVAMQTDRFLLNGRPLKLEMILDQGLWPDTGMTAPDDMALRKDVELAKAMGFNGVRKHQKIEDPRYLYWADVLGLLVWEEMPSAYRYNKDSIARLTAQWHEVIDRDYSHPCIVVWVPFNESWGVPNLPDSAAERHYVQALYHLTKTLDQTRLVVGNDGWEAVATDIIGVHDYDEDPLRIAHRYHADRLKPRLLKKERPGGRELIVGEQKASDHPLVLSEFGGIALAGDKGWGYSTCKTPEELQQRYENLMDVVRDLGIFCGFCYTQFTDTYQEANGLLYADRRPKFPLDAIARATRGRRGDRPALPDAIPALIP